MKRKVKRVRVVPHQKSKLTITPKLLVFVLCVILLFGVVYLGMKYQRSLISQDSTNTTKFENVHTPTRIPRIDTSNWKIFENEKFTIKYPADWRVGITPLIGDSAPSFHPTNEDYPLFQVAYLKLDDYVGTCKEDGLREVKRTINGVDVVECVGTTTGIRKGRETDEIAQWRHLVIVGKNNKFSFNYLYISDNQNNYYEELFDAFLKSFVIK